MANVTYGPTISDARGLCGGIVYTRTHAGACIQARPRVVNPRTPAQLWVRRLVGLTNQAWSTTLSPGDRAAWASAAAQAIERTTVGTQFTHTPQSYYTRHALNSANAGGSTSVAPPTGPLQHSPGALTLTAGGSPPSIQLTTANPIPDGCGVIIMATPSLRAGICQYQRYYRQLRNADLSPVLPSQLPDLTTPYLATHHGWNIGQTIALTAAFVRLADGEKGPTTMKTALSHGRSHPDLLRTGHHYAGPVRSTAHKRRATPARSRLRTHAPNSLRRGPLHAKHHPASVQPIRLLVGQLQRGPEQHHLPRRGRQRLRRHGRRSGGHFPTTANQPR